MNSLTPKRFSSPGRSVSFSEPLVVGPAEAKSKDLLSSDSIIAWTQRPSISPQETQKLADARERDEKALIVSQPVCPVMNPGSPPKNLNIPNMKDLMNSAFYDPEVMTQVFCNLDGLILSAEQSGSTRKIRRLMGGLKRIGAPSAYGVAMSADFNQKESYGFFDAPDGALIVKTTKDKTGDSTLLHEYVVGVFGLNPLRSFIPNFAFILGAFKCSPPILRDKEVITYCEASPNINYVLYEFIKGSSVKEAIKNMSSTDFICYFYQICLALRLAHLQCDFTHYDLHSENVLLRTVHSKVAYEKNKQDPNFNPDKFWIPYPRSGGEILVHTEAIPTIIDYGTSHMRYKDKSFGNPDLMKFGVIANQSFPMHDIYKFTMSCGLAAAEAENSDVLNVCETVFTFFNKSEPFLDALAKQWNSGTFLFPPPEVGLVSIRHDEFIKFFESAFSEEIAKFTMPATSTPTDGLVLSCGGNMMCIAPREVERALLSNTPNSLLDALENKQQISRATFANLEEPNRKDFLLAISKSSEDARALQPTWFNIQDMTGDMGGYYKQLLYMTSLLDNSWQARRYAIAALEKGAEVFKDNAAANDTDSFYRNEYTNYTSTFSAFITSILDHFAADMGWLESSPARGNISEMIPNINNVIDFQNAYVTALGPGRKIVSMIQPVQIR